MSRSPRFHAPSIPASGLVTLDEAESAHAVRVLRLAAGDAVTLLDGAGQVAEAHMVDPHPKRASCQVLSVRQETPLAPRICVYGALPKGCAEEMVDQLAQLGCDLFVPMATDRSVVEARDNKVEKLRRAAREAGKQAIRAFAMEVGEPVDFAKALAAAKGGSECLRLIADPRGAAADVLAQAKAAREISVLIGPEGGFTDDEIRQAEAAGFRPWRFAPFVLRIETAAVGAVAVLRAAVA